MPDQTENTGSPSPELRDKREKPQGVVPKQSQAYVMVAVTIVILFAVLFSNHRGKTAKPSPSTPLWAQSAPANSQTAIQQLKRELTEEQQRAEQETQQKVRQQQTDPAQSTADEDRNRQSTNSKTAETQRDPIADAERALKFKARFSSNLVVTTDVSAHSEEGQQTTRPSLPAADNHSTEKAAFQLARKEDTSPTKRP